jgi:hypothetical protein
VSRAAGDLDRAGSRTLPKRNSESGQPGAGKTKAGVLGDPDALVVRHPRARGDEPAHDDVLLETAQVVDAAGDGRLGEQARGFLED